MSEVRAHADALPAPTSLGRVAVDLIALVKPRIMVMALLTAAGAAALAPGVPDTTRTLLLLVGTAFIVGSANALNMYLERDIDCMMTRTRNRPLPQRRLAPGTALWFGVALGAASVPLLFAAGTLTGGLGLVALASYVAVYTPLKQRTHWATWIGAVPGALPVLMGWAAATESIDAAGLSVFAVLFFWQIPHFHAIAMYRQREYKDAGLKTLPGEHGAAAARVQIGVFLVVQVAASLAVAACGVTGTPYLVVAIALGALVLAQGLPGVRHGDLRWARRVFAASLVYLPILFITMVLDGRL
ncbi:MAG: heme o synthase [Kofleriaceae bacterium]